MTIYSFPVVSKKILTVFFLIFSLASFSQEICNNGIDDDNDGLIDLNDSVNCICGAGTPSVVPSLIPNPSFETMSFCPTSYSQLNGATGWIQATSATSDYMNTCGYIFPAAVSSGLVPFPNGNGIVGGYVMQDYKEYIGSCLLSPMIAGTSYQITFNIASTPIDPSNDTELQSGGIGYGPIDITIYGSSSCSNLPVSTLDCPSAASPSTWSVLGAASYTPVASWGLTTITFTPSTNINAIMIGGPCNPPASYPSGNPSSPYYPYFYYDNLVLNNSAAFGLVSITSTGSYCTSNIVLTANISSTVTSGAVLQWYLNGVAIVGSTGSTYNVPVGAAGLGNYQVKLTDGTVCALSGIYPVTSTPPSISVNSASLCPGGTTTITATSVYNNYTWNTTATSNSIVVSPANTTTYSVIGSLGTCTAQATSTVTIYTSSITVSGNTLVCAGQSTTLTASGANNYSWNESGSSTLNNYFSSVVVSTPFTTTTYTVNGSSGAGASFCTSQAIITVSIIPSPTITVSPVSSVICPGDAVTLTATLIGSTTQTWSTGSNAQSITVNPISNTIYTVSTSAGSCTIQALAYVNMDAGPNLFVNSPTICYGQTTTLTVSGANTYTWNTGAHTNTISVSPNSNTTYTVSGSNGMTCASIVISTVTVTHPIANYSGIDGSPMPVGTNLSLVNTSSNATNYKWELCDGVVSTNTNVTIALTDVENCCVKLIAYQSVCVDSITKCFSIVPEFFISIPNVFTPNGDTKNDFFKINSAGLKSLHCVIFDRWGLKMYEWDGINGSWNGNTKTGAAPDGTYFYIVNYTDLRDKSDTEKGFLNLFR